MQDFSFKPKAFLFDLNGTMINDMDYHTQAWYGLIHNELDAGLGYDAVKKEMYGKNREVLERVFGKDKFTEAEVEKLSFEKEKRYQDAYRPHLKLLDGLDDFLKKAKQHHILLAIGSAAIPENIDLVIDGLQIKDDFATIVSADDVKLSKPDPETFLKAAQQLNIRPEDCLVFEDAPKGVEAALNAGMKCIVLTTTHTPEDFTYNSNILAFIHDYHDQTLNLLF